MSAPFFLPPQECVAFTPLTSFRLVHAGKIIADRFPVHFERCVEKRGTGAGFAEKALFSVGRPHAVERAAAFLLPAPVAGFNFVQLDVVHNAPPAPRESTLPAWGVVQTEKVAAERAQPVRLGAKHE